MSEAVFVARPSTALPDLRVRWRLALACVLCVLLAVGVGYVRPKRAAPSVATTIGPVTPAWIELPQPVHIFALETPLLNGVALTYSARRLANGGGREDVLVFGVPGVEAPAVRLRLQRRAAGGEANPPSPLFATVAREAAEAGLAIERAGLADLLSSRFGAVEVVDLSLGDGSGQHVPCAGFRLTVPSPALTLVGLACGALGQPLERSAIACLLDRLDLASDDGDRAMIDFFASAQRRRDRSCAGPEIAPVASRPASPDGKPVTHVKSLRRR